MIRRMALYLTGALAAILVAATFALTAVPQTISYQGYLTDSGGNPVNGTIQMKLSLYSSPTSTNTLWTETHQSVQVTQGSYSVVLGNGSPTPVPINLPFDVPYYLGVTVGADAEMTPRLPLTSMGYAFRAAQADSINSQTTITATNAIVSTVPTGVAPLQVSSTTLVPNLNVEMVGGMHATDFVAKAGDTMTGSLTISPGNLVLSATTTTSGIIRQGGNTLIHTYGEDNFFAGTNAGNLTMTGDANTASGRQALYSNTTGFGNTASGVAALYSNTTGFANTANGGSALQNNISGFYNTATGYYALGENTTGYANTASGYQALISNATGVGNTANGNGALYSNTTGGANTAIGNGALNANINGLENTASGNFALYSNTTGSYNTAIGSRSLINNITGSYNTAIGYATNVNLNGLTNATAVGNGAYVTASNYVRIGNTAVTHIGGQVGFSNDSDLREKKDIQDLGYGLGFIKQLRPVQFRMKNGNDRIDFGFIAQDIETLLGTNYNVLGIGGNSDRTLSLRYTDFIAPMVKAMQEQQEIIEKQDAKITSQQAQIDELKAEIAALKQRLP